MDIEIHEIVYMFVLTHTERNEILIKDHLYTNSKTIKAKGI